MISRHTLKPKAFPYFPPKCYHFVLQKKAAKVTLRPVLPNETEFGSSRRKEICCNQCLARSVSPHSTHALIKPLAWETAKLEERMETSAAV